MKVVAYSIKQFEKEFLIRANKKRHDITLISNPLSVETASFAAGKDAVLVYTNDDVSAPVIKKLAALGVKFIAARGISTDNIDKSAAQSAGIKLANIPTYSSEAIAEQTVLLALALSRRLIRANEQVDKFDFRLDDLMGFNLHGKTVGLIGVGHTGLAAAAIFKGFGCKVLGYDIDANKDHDHVPLTEIGQLLAESDIISLHAPLTDETRGMINRTAIAKMKDGVMIINTSRGGLIKIADVLNSLDSGKIGYLGLDVYESEKEMFFDEHKNDAQKDALLKRLIDHPNALVTPHQGFLTKEALQEIANRTIDNLDLWQKEIDLSDTGIAGKENREKIAATTLKLDQMNLLP